MSIQIPVDKKRIEDFCRRNHIQRLSFFGSVLRSDFRPNSDVDVLIEFESGQIVGFIRLYEIEQELSSLLAGHKPDIVNPRFLNRRIRDRVLQEAQVQYAKG